MSWSDRLRRHPLIRPVAVLLRTGPGLATLALVLAVLSIGGGWAAQHSDEARAQAAPTPMSVTSVATATRTASPTATSTATATRRSPTPTWTPQPTAPAPVSPLATPMVAVPLPPAIFGPRVAPPATVTVTVSVEVGNTITATTPVTAAAPITPAETASLLPTPTPAATQTITDALAMPLPPAGLGALVATAESVVAIATPLPPEPTPTPTSAAQPTPDGTVRTARVPVLMYHYLSVPPADTDVYRRDLSVAPDLFAAHLDAMLAAGYTTITPYQLLAHLTQGAPLPDKPVVLTFDDGYRDNYENAFPLLRERGMVATFFVLTDFIDEQRPAYLTWDMAREMYAAGMPIESHGRNHVSLKNKDSDYLVWQALGSLETIQYELGVRPRFVSYPAGDYDQLTVDIFRSADYWAGFTTQQGATHRSDDLFQLRRVRIRGTTTAAEVVRLLGLDW